MACLLLQVITDLFALLTICCRRCICCSVFTVCGSVQSFAGMLFVIGLVAYPAGWGHEYIKTVRISECVTHKQSDSAGLGPGLG